MIFAIIMALIGLAVIFWIIGFFCGVDNSLSPLPYRELYPRPELYSWEYEGLKSKVSRLEGEIRFFNAELVNQRMNYITQYPHCLMRTEEKSNWLNKDLCATKKQAEEKIEELRKILCKI